MTWYMRPISGQPELTNSSGITNFFLEGRRVGIALNGMWLLLDLRSSVDKIVTIVVHEMIVS